MLTNHELRTILRAASRPAPHYVCPTPFRIIEQSRLLIHLRRKGMVSGVGNPTLTFKAMDIANAMMKEPV